MTEAKTYCNMAGETRSQKSGGGASTYCMYVMPVTAFCAPDTSGEMRYGGTVVRGWRRCQGGGGADHLAQVQQKSTQTDSRLFGTPSLSFPFAQIMCRTCETVFMTPWAIPTSESNPNKLLSEYDYFSDCLLGDSVCPNRVDLEVLVLTPSPITTIKSNMS